MKPDRDSDNLLVRAEKMVITTGVGDTAEHLCRLNMRYGLAKIHHYQLDLGMDPDALFIGAPDATVTRNQARWISGFGYGGLLRWTGDFVPIEAKPNGCGLLMVGLRQDPGRGKTMERLAETETSGLSVEGRSVCLDIRHSNHFLEVCRPSAEAAQGLGWDGPVALLHSSGGEFRGRTELGPGLYWDQSEALRDLAVRHDTPWGDLWIVEGARARDYLDECHRVHTFQMKRRLAIAEALLGPDIEVLFHGMHQGLHDLGTLTLGCYLHDGTGKGRSPFVETPAGVFPITLSADLPIFLVKAKPSLASSAIDRIGADLAALTDRQRAWLDEAHIVPHGGGTTFPDLTDVDVLEQGPRRRFTAQLANRTVHFEYPRSLPFSYRGTEVSDRTMALGLADSAGTMSVTWWIGAEA